MVLFVKGTFWHILQTVSFEGQGSQGLVMKDKVSAGLAPFPFLGWVDFMLVCHVCHS